MKIGVTLGCIVAALLFVIAAVTKYNSLENRLENVEGRPAKPQPADEPSPTTAKPVLATTKEGEEVMVQPVAVNVTAKELACLKLINDYTAIGIDFREPVKQQLKDMHCFEDANAALPPKSQVR